jgi:hypothetical protein
MQYSTVNMILSSDVTHSLQIHLLTEGEVLSPLGSLPYIFRKALGLVSIKVMHCAIHITLAAQSKTLSHRWGRNFGSVHIRFPGEESVCFAAILFDMASSIR